MSILEGYHQRPKGYTLRQCLKCNREFRSTCNSHRLCEGCNESNHNLGYRAFTKSEADAPSHQEQ